MLPRNSDTRVPASGIFHRCKSSGSDYNISEIEMPNSQHSDEIRTVLKRINGAWLSGNPDAVRRALSSCFHPEMVIKDGNLKTVAAGRDACARSYIDFIKQARVSNFEQGEADIHLFGGSAIASYDWRIAYSLDRKTYDERGSDIFVFLREEGNWIAIWRAMITTTR